MTPVPSGCPRCGAHTRPGAQWCGLCHTNLRATTVRATVPASDRVSVPQAAHDLAESSVRLQQTPEPAPRTAAQPEPLASAEPAPLAPTASTGRGKHARHDPAEESPPQSPPPPGRGRRGVAVDEDVLGPDAMLALLAAESSKPLGGLTGRLESTGARIALMAGGMVAIAGLLFIVMAILGSML